MGSADGTGLDTPPGTVVCDLDGVVYLGTTPIPGAGEALEAVQRMGWHIVFATNNSTKTRRDVLSDIASRTGFTSDRAEVVTSGMAAAHALPSDARIVLAIGEPGLADVLADAGRTVAETATADAVVVGLDRHISYDKLAMAVTAVRSDAGFYATNSDVTFPTPDGPAPGAGSIVAAIAAASERAPVVCGKPEQPMLDLVGQMTVGDVVIAVGDRPETDIALARRAGWLSALVLTGVTKRHDLVPDRHRPDHVLDSIADLPGLLGTIGEKNRA